MGGAAVGASVTNSLVKCGAVRLLASAIFRPLKLGPLRNQQFTIKLN